MRPALTECSELPSDAFRLAERLAAAGLGWEILLRSRDRLPSEIRCDIERLLPLYLAGPRSATAPDVSGYESVFAPDSPDVEHRAAVARLAFDLSDAYRWILIDRLRRAPNPSGDFFRRFPDVYRACDDDGLLPMDWFLPYLDALVYREVAVLPLWLPQELRLFLADLRARTGLRIRIGLDPWHTWAVEEYRRATAEQRSWGLPFRENDLHRALHSRKRDVQETQYRRAAPTTREEELLSHLRLRLNRLDVMRKDRPDCVSFLFEELVPIDAVDRRVGTVVTRMFHAEFDRGRRVFRHADGSRLLYDLPTYDRRLGGKASAKVKAGQRVKLFRLDGSIPMADWANVLITYFNRNELVGEFLRGD